MKIDIPHSLIQYYLGALTNWIIIDHGIPLTDPSEYQDDYFEELKRRIPNLKEKEYLKWAIDYILNYHNIDTGQYENSEYMWSDKEMRPLIAEVRKRLWKNEETTSDKIMHNISLTNENLRAWRDSLS